MNEIIEQYPGQPQMPEGAVFIGTDKHGFRYYQAPDNYVYQVYPESDHFVGGKNKKNMFNGWIASGPAWERTLHSIIEGGKNANR